MNSNSRSRNLMARPTVLFGGSQLAPLLVSGKDIRMTSMRLLARSTMGSIILASTTLRGATGPDPPTGNWMNPKGTVEVNTRSCGPDLCGRVVWASPEAIRDAREGGTPNLLGTELLRNYRAVATDRWRGAIFVPDMGRSFSSKILELGPNRLQVSGCVVGGMICKKQVWHRARPAGAKPQTEAE